MFGALKRAVRWARAEYLVRTDPLAYARSIGVKIGEGSRIYTNERGIFGSEPFLVSLGNRCFIAEGVRFITHDGTVALLRYRQPDLDVMRPIHVGNNVAIGIRAIILPGVHIGDNCIIGAGAVVSRDVPDNSVVVGVPARVVMTVDQHLRRIIPHSLGTARNSEKAAVLKHLFQ